MSKKVKTKEVLVAWQVLGQAKYDKLDSDQKVRVFHIGQMLKPIATAFSDYSADAAEKMQPSADFQERWDKAKVYETMTANPKADMEQLPMGPAEYKEFMVKEYFPFDRLWKKAIKDEGDKEVELKFDPISEEVLFALADANKWNVDQTTAVAAVVCK
jgi:hypothetical protein